ncbi:hypothetical protein R2R35_19625 [Anaerocolumna sp. AGMB13020]|uniref:hypothetical protein n=1 Tax=Anaerocolumna sp. AGMB13020 TaxID=3081750 RepID=UPI002954DC49|nr:hypothetical protein [Anaerocolumna sp. AGMB13020]WOO35982.1 hypothetical protein R2R35_19625 [Anaerocolumna sp. AGMB13020]
MTVTEAIELFQHEMINEIYNSSADDLSKDSLVEAVKEVAATVMSTYKAEKS